MAAPGQPVFSIIMTAGGSSVLTAADFNAASPYWASIANVGLITKLVIDYDATTVGPHYLILSPDHAQTAIASPTAKPFWVLPVYPANQTFSGALTRGVPNELSFYQPFAGTQLDLYFQTQRWPSSTSFFKPTALTVCVEYYASKQV